MRNHVISICKGIAIILMVVGHTEGPGFLMHIVYLFHMPIFFITAGYFFSRKYLSDPWSFVVKRFKGLYVPMVKWSLFFLLIHNLMFRIGLLSEHYGNWENGVTHPYNLHTFLQRAVNIVTSMSGYDEFLAGAFWFFRALLISSILFLALYYVLDGKWRRLRGNGIVVCICLAALGFAALKIGNGLKVVNVVQGGIREAWGVFFFGVGVLYRSYEHRIKEHWVPALVYAGILCGRQSDNTSQRQHHCRWYRSEDAGQQYVYLYPEKSGRYHYRVRGRTDRQLPGYGRKPQDDRGEFRSSYRCGIKASGCER